MLFSNLSDKKKKTIGYSLPFAVIVFVPSFDILLRCLGRWDAFEKYAMLGMIIACVWLPLISPALLIVSAVFSRRMAKTHIIYDGLMIVLLFILSSLLYRSIVPEMMQLFMFYLYIRVICFGLAYIIVRLIRK